MDNPISSTGTDSDPTQIIDNQTGEVENLLVDNQTGDNQTGVYQSLTETGNTENQINNQDIINNSQEQINTGNTGNIDLSYIS